MPPRKRLPSDWLEIGRLLNTFLGIALPIGELAAVGTAMCWSVSIIFFKLSAQNIHPLALNLLKTVLGLIFFILLLALQKNTIWIPELPTVAWVRMCVSAFLGVALGDTLIVLTVKRVGAGPTAVLECFYSPLVILLSFAFLGEPLVLTHLLGATFVIISVVILSSEISPEEGTRAFRWDGILLGILTQICIVGAILLVRDLYMTIDLIWLAGFRYLVGSLYLVIMEFCRGGFKGDTMNLRSISQKRFLWPLLGGAFFGTFFSNIFWFAGFKYAQSSVAAVLNQLSTAMTVALAALFLNEGLSPKKMLSVFLAILGALIVTH